MPAPKRDLETIHGRLKFARESAGYTRAQFAKLLGRSQRGWAQIELGTRSLTADMLLEANTVLKLDERYYFGKLEYDSAQKQSSGDAAEMRQVITEYKSWKESLTKRDSLAQRIMADAELQEAVELLIENRGLVSKVVGYIEGRSAEREERRTGT